MKYKYIYPKFLAVKNLGFIRIGGCGLANCLFTYANAISVAHKTGAGLIAPTWLNFSIGTYLRHQTDKRHYCGLIGRQGEKTGIKRICILLFRRDKIQTIYGVGHHFVDFIDDAEYVSKYIVDHIASKHKRQVDEFDFTHSVAVHVRLGDYQENQRLPIQWYVEKINGLKQNGFSRFLLFSDGKDEELKDLLQMPGVNRVFFGSAISDIYAMSRCSYIIGSDSTFSGWGAFLGQVPCCFHHKFFGPVLKKKDDEITEFSMEFIEKCRRQKNLSYRRKIQVIRKDFDNPFSL